MKFVLLSGGFGIDLSWITDFIFNAIADKISDFVGSVLDLFSISLLSILSLDLTVLEQMFTFIVTAYSVIRGFAMVLMWTICIFQLARAMLGPMTDAEEPLKLIIRTSLFSFFVYTAKDVTLYAVNLAKVPYAALQSIEGGTGAISFSSTQTTLLGAIGGTIDNVFAIIVTVILILIIAWNYFKLCLEAVERYAILGVLVYTSPLAFSMGPAQSTKNVFRAWIKMVGSQIVLMMSSVFFLRGFAYAYSLSVSSFSQILADLGMPQSMVGAATLWCFLLIAWLKIGQRFDSYLHSLGLYTAQTGGNMMAELLATTHMVKTAYNSTVDVLNGLKGHLHQHPTGGTANQHPTGGTANPASANHVSDPARLGSPQPSGTQNTGHPGVNRDDRSVGGASGSAKPAETVFPCLAGNENAVGAGNGCSGGKVDTDGKIQDTGGNIVGGNNMDTGNDKITQDASSEEVQTPAVGAENDSIDNNVIDIPDNYSSDAVGDTSLVGDSISHAGISDHTEASELHTDEASSSSAQPSDANDTSAVGSKGESAIRTDADTHDQQTDPAPVGKDSSGHVQPGKTSEGAAFAGHEVSGRMGESDSTGGSVPIGSGDTTRVRETSAGVSSSGLIGNGGPNYTGENSAAAYGSASAGKDFSGHVQPSQTSEGVISSGHEASGRAGENGSAGGSVPIGSGDTTRMGETSAGVSSPGLTGNGESNYTGESSAIAYGSASAGKDFSGHVQPSQTSEGVISSGHEASGRAGENGSAGGSVPIGSGDTTRMGETSAGVSSPGLIGNGESNYTGESSAVAYGSTVGGNDTSSSRGVVGGTEVPSSNAYCDAAGTDFEMDQNIGVDSQEGNSINVGDFKPIGSISVGDFKPIGDIAVFSGATIQPTRQDGVSQIDLANGCSSTSYSAEKFEAPQTPHTTMTDREGNTHYITQPNANYEMFDGLTPMQNMFNSSVTDAMDISRAKNPDYSHISDGKFTFYGGMINGERVKLAAYDTALYRPKGIEGEDYFLRQDQNGSMWVFTPKKLHKYPLPRKRRK